MSTAYGATAAASTPEKESTEAEDAREGILHLRPRLAAENHKQASTKPQVKSSQVKSSQLACFPGIIGEAVQKQQPVR